MSLFIRYNNENVLMRAVIAGLLNVLNNHIQYEQVWGDDDIETVKVPWFYNQSGDQRLLQDLYTHYGTCLPPRPVDGQFDRIPRGVITYKGSPIDEQRITTRYIQGKYVKEEEGQLNSYVSYLYSIPLSTSFEAEMWIDKELSAMKIEQEIREVFYKTITFYVYYKGMRIGCTAGFPAETRIDKMIRYSHEPEMKVKLNFNIEVETYQPVFDPTTEMLADNNIKSFGVNLYKKDQKDYGEIKDVSIRSDFIISSPVDNSIIPKNVPLWIEWKYIKEGATLNNVNIYWLDHGTDVRNKIELHYPNKEFYIWNIPDNFTEFKQPTILWDERKNSVDPISISREPLVKIIPDLSTGEILPSSFQIFDEGYFYTALSDASINVELEMIDDDGNLQYSPDNSMWAIIKHNKLDSFEIDGSIYFPGTVHYKTIDVQIANSVNKDVYGVLNNIKIV